MTITYQETTISGSEYRRARMIQINNQLNTTPTITFTEEQVTLIGTKILSQDVDQLSIAYNPNGIVDLLDPTTGLATNQTMTHAQLYQVLYSLYIKLATDRDIANQTITQVQNPGVPGDPNSPQEGQ